MAKRKVNIPTEIGSPPTNDAEVTIGYSNPYRMAIEIEGVADMLFHRWSCDDVAAKANAAKNSVAKKTDNLESYVYRMENGNIALPGTYIRGTIVKAAKFRQDPRSPRKSAEDLYKAGVHSLTILADLGKAKWDYEDRDRVNIQRNGITRTRPAFKAGWKAKFILCVYTPEYIQPTDLVDVITNAGRLIGVGDHRPTFGRFVLKSWKILDGVV